MNAPRLLRSVLVALTLPAASFALLARHNEQGLSPTHTYKRSGPSAVVSNLNGNLVVSSTAVAKPGAPLGVTVSRTWNSHWRDPVFTHQYDMDYSVIDYAKNIRQSEYKDRDISDLSPAWIGGFATRRIYRYDEPTRIPNTWAFAQSVAVDMLEAAVRAEVQRLIAAPYADYLRDYEARKLAALASGKDFQPEPRDEQIRQEIAAKNTAALQAINAVFYMATSARQDFQVIGECASSATGGRNSASGDCVNAAMNVTRGFGGLYVDAYISSALNYKLPYLSLAQMGYNIAQGNMSAEDIAWMAGSRVAEMLVADAVGGGVAGGIAGVAVGTAIAMVRLQLALQAQWDKTFDIGMVQISPWATGVNGYLGMLGMNHESHRNRANPRFQIAWKDSVFDRIDTLRDADGNILFNSDSTPMTQEVWTTTRRALSRHAMPDLQLVGADGGASRFILSDDSAIVVDGRRWLAYVALSNSDQRQVYFALPPGVVDTIDLGYNPSEETVAAAQWMDSAGYYLVKEPDGTQVIFGMALPNKGIHRDHAGFETYWAVPMRIRHASGDSVLVVRDDSLRISAAWDARTGRGGLIRRRSLPPLRYGSDNGFVSPGGSRDMAGPRAIETIIDAVFDVSAPGSGIPPVVRLVDSVVYGLEKREFDLNNDEKLGPVREFQEGIVWEARGVSDAQTDTTRFIYQNGDLTRIAYPNGSATEYLYPNTRMTVQDGFVQRETQLPDPANPSVYLRRIFDYQGWDASRPQALYTDVTTILSQPNYVPNDKTTRTSQTTDRYVFTAMVSGRNVNRQLAGYAGRTTVLREDGTVHDTDKVVDSLEYRTSRFELAAEYHGHNSPGMTRTQWIWDGDRKVAEIRSRGMGRNYDPRITVWEYDGRGSVVRERVCPHDINGLLLQRLAEIPGVPGIAIGCPEVESRFGVTHRDRGEFWMIERDTVRLKDTLNGGGEKWLTAIVEDARPNPAFRPDSLFALGLQTSKRIWRVGAVRGGAVVPDTVVVGDSTEYVDWRASAQAMALPRPVRKRAYLPGSAGGDWPRTEEIAYAEGAEKRPTLPVRVMRYLSEDSVAVVETDYDSLYRLLPVRERRFVQPQSPGSSPSGPTLVTTRSYDLDRALVLHEVDPSGRATRTLYDRAGRPTLKTAPDGGTTKYEFLDRLEPMSSWVPAAQAQQYPALRTVAVRETGPSGVATEARFDGAGRILAVRRLAKGAKGKVTDPALSHTTLLAYNIFDKLQWTRDADGREEFHDYDGTGRLIASRNYVSPAGGALSLAWEKLYAWDDSARTLVEEDEVGTRTTFHWDGLGRDTLIERGSDLLPRLPGGTVSAGVRGGGGSKVIRVRQAFDNLGNLVRLEDPKGLIETRRYDLRGRLIETVYPDELRHAAGYDRAGRLVLDSLQGMRQGASVAESLVIKSMRYDALDRVLEERFLHGGTAAGVAAGFASREDVRYRWDRFGDAEDRGLLVGLERGTGLVVRYAFDEAARRKERAVEHPAFGYDVTMATAYDLAGLPRTLSLPGAARFSTGFDAFHRLSSLSLVHGADSVALLHGLAYRANDLQTGFRLGRRLETRFSYEPQRSVLTENLAVQLRAGSNAVQDTLYRQAFSWGAAGHLVGMLRGAGDSLTYLHDRLGQLRITGRRDGEDSLSFDANGNRTRHRFTMDGGIRDSFAYLANRVRLAQSGRRGVTIYRHDLQGNLALEAHFASAADTSELSRAWRLVERRFNRRNELERALVVDRLGAEKREVLRFEYGEDGNRIASLWPASITGSDTIWEVARRWAYDGPLITADSGAGHGWTWHGYNGLNRIAEGTDSSGRLHMRYLLTDHQGTTQALLDDTGAVLGRWAWDPWGNVEESWTNRTTDLLYQGKAFEPALGSWYFNARWYDPEMGRFTSRDPMLQFWTPYSYVGNGPLTGIDPDGREVNYSVACDDGPGSRETLRIDVTGVIVDETGSLTDLSAARDFIAQQLSESWTTDITGVGKIELNANLAIEGVDRARLPNDHVFRVVGDVAIEGKIYPSMLGANYPIGSYDMQLARRALSPMHVRTIGHEFGHAMGLLHETDLSQANLMWQTKNSFSQRITPGLYDALRAKAK